MIVRVIPSLLCTLAEHTLNALSCSDGGDCSVLGFKERTCICVTVGIVHTIFMFVPMYLSATLYLVRKISFKVQFKYNTAYEFRTRIGKKDLQRREHACAIRKAKFGLHSVIRKYLSTCSNPDLLRMCYKYNTY